MASKFERNDKQKYADGLWKEAMAPGLPDQIKALKLQRLLAYKGENAVELGLVVAADVKEGKKAKGKEAKAQEAPAPVEPEAPAPVEPEAPAPEPEPEPEPEAPAEPEGEVA